MARPVVNVTKTVGEITVHRDLDDIALFHYRPVVHWSDLSVTSLGSKLTSLGGRIGFDLLESEFAQLKAAFPQGRFAPLVAKDVTGAAVSVIEASPPHSLTIRVVNSLPFPHVVVAGSLRKQETNHDELLAAIESAWSAKTLVAGDLRIVFGLSRVVAAYDVNVTPAVAVSELVAATGGKGWGSAAELWSAVEATVAQRFDEFVKPIFASGVPGLRTEAASVLKEIVHREYVFDDGAMTFFDEGLAVRRYRVRDAAEFDSNKPAARLSKATAEDLQFQCF